MATQDLTYEQLYTDLVKASKHTLPDGAFTLVQFIEDTGLTRYSAQKQLNERVDVGELRNEKMLVDGKLQNVYWFIRNVP